MDYGRRNIHRKLRVFHLVRIELYDNIHTSVCFGLFQKKSSFIIILYILFLKKNYSDILNDEIHNTFIKIFSILYKANNLLLLLKRSFIYSIYFFYNLLSRSVPLCAYDIFPR